jgi:chromosome segregation ATPase
MGIDCGGICTKQCKPHLNDNKYISITHSHEFAAIVISNQTVGIDIELQRENVQSRRFQSEREDLERMIATLKSDWERSMMEKMHEREQEFEQIRTRLEAAKQEAENQLQAEKLDKTRIESAQANARAEIDTIRKQAEQEAARLRAEAGSLRGQVERLAKDLETREGAVGER